MSSGSGTRLWNAYTQLKIWVGDTASRSKIFEVLHCSMDDSDSDIPSDARSNNAASNQLTIKFETIIGLIYPSTDPFRQQGLKIEIRIPETFPREPPEVYMKIKIRHPNIDKNGRICSDLLDPKRIYNRSSSLADVVKIIVGLLDNPETGHVVDAEAGSVYDSQREVYNRSITESVMKNEPR